MGKVDFGRFYALIVGNQNYRCAREPEDAALRLLSARQRSSAPSMALPFR